MNCARTSISVPERNVLRRTTPENKTAPFLSH
jgi:hypothetical protein